MVAARDEVEVSATKVEITTQGAKTSRLPLGQLPQICLNRCSESESERWGRNHLQIIWPARSADCTSEESPAGTEEAESAYRKVT